MIYNNNFFSKELKLGYVEWNISKKRQLSLGVFLGLLAFAFYFFLQTVKKSVINDVAPQLLYDSYFSTIYIYINLSMITYIMYIMIYFEYLTFAEIVKNKWYVLVKLGHKPLKMIFTKITARILSTLFIYSVGFLTIIFLTSFLKFPMVLTYFLSLYIVGMVDLILISLVTMTLSLFFKKAYRARYSILLTLLGVFILKWKTNYLNLVSQRTEMRNPKILFNFEESRFMIYFILIILISIGVSIIKARNMAMYYNLPTYKENIGLKEEVEILVPDKKKGSFVRSTDYKGREKNLIFSYVLNFSLSTLLIISILINAFILLISLSTSGREIAVFGKIPYIFLSETMEPTIMYNDLAFFSKIPPEKIVEKGEIILYKDRRNEVGIGRVMEEEGEDYIVDIDNYVENKKIGTLKEKVSRGQIYGVFYNRSRWLGALVLFANSTIGRLLLLLIPTFLIFFYKPIIKFFSEALKGGLKE